MTTPAERDPARLAWRAILDLAMRHLDATRRAADDLGLGLSPVMGHFLNMLVRLPPGPMAQLATELQVDAAWVTSVVDRLEARGYVARVPSPSDRRVKILEVTDAGRNVWQTLDRLVSTPPAEFLRLGPDELASLIGLGEHARGGAADRRRRASPASARILRG